MRQILLVLNLCLCLVSGISFAEVKILCIVAHPDDEVAFAATIYKVTHDLKGSVDVTTITNGEGGYRYSTLAEPIYCLNLTDETIGKTYLPNIRKEETLRAAKILGVRRYHFLDQKDTGFTENLDQGFLCVWNLPWVKEFLLRRLKEGEYDFVFTLLPHASTHAHHKAATLLALQAVSELDSVVKPIILAVDTPVNEPRSFSELPGYPLTKIREGIPLFKFHKLQPLGYQGKLNYQVIVNWVIAEHKSQGALQLLMNKGSTENFYFFNLNSENAIDKTRQFFGSLNR